MRDLILRESGNNWRAPADSLHASLLAPVEQAGWLDDVRLLYVVPHGILQSPAFAALSRGRQPNARLLLDDYVVAYLPAASALGATQPEPRPAETMLAMAPARTGLRYSRQEVTAVARLFVKERMVLSGLELEAAGGEDGRLEVRSTGTSPRRARRRHSAAAQRALATAGGRYGQSFRPDPEIIARPSAATVPRC